MTTETTDADAAIEEARAEVARLNQAVLDGDTTITAAQLAEADAEVVRRELLAQGARLRSDKDAEAQRLAAIERVRAELLDDFDGATADEMVDLFEAAVAASAAFAVAVVEHNGRVREAARRLIDLRPLPPDLNPRTDGDRIRLGEGVDAEPYDVARMLTEAAWRAAVECGDAYTSAQLAGAVGVATAGAHEVAAFGCEPGHQFGPVGQLQLIRQRYRRSQVA